MRRAAPLVLLIGLLASGCGSGSGKSVPGLNDGTTTTTAPASATGDAAVIRGWSEALRSGNVDKAAGFFALPSVVANGTGPLELHSRSQVRGFNQTLPCGARYLRSTPHHGYVIAEFKLTSRTGPGAEASCTGKGNKADVAFRIAHGKIAEWRRTAAYPGETPGNEPPAGNNFT